MPTRKRGSNSNVPGEQVPNAPEFDHAVPSSPIPLPTKTPYRPIPQSYSTNSSTSSNTSTSSSGSTFDVEKSTPSLDESPTTSDDEYADSPRPKPTAQFGRLSDITSPLAPKKNGTRKIPTTSKSNISSRSVDKSTSSKPPLGIQTRSSKLRSSLTASKKESNLSFDESLSVPELSPTRIRSTSAPPASANLPQSPRKREDQELDIDRLWHVPGRYPSWNSNIDFEIEVEARAKPADEFGDSGADDVPLFGFPRRDRPQPQNDTFTPQDGQASREEVEIEASPTPGAADQGEPGVTGPKYQRPNFVPFECSDDDRTKNKQIEKKEINNRILKYIKQKHKQPTESGWVYMYKHEPPEHKDLHLKIGKTTDTPSVRLTHWKKCKLPFKEILDDYENPFDYHGLVESILHIELHNVRKKFHCQVCRKPHDEWFEVDVSIPLQKRKTWRNWLRIQKPFENGQLTPYWEWRTKRAKLHISNIKWEEWTQPGPFDFYRYYFETFDRIGLVAHFSSKRKDTWFRFMAIIITLLLLMFFGQAAAIWGVLALLVL